MAVNGRQYDWESVEIRLPNGLAIGITEISYNDERGIEARYGKGATPRGWGRKNYKASGSMSLDKDEYERFRLSQGGSVYTDTPFTVIVSYGMDGLDVITDVLPDCLVTKQDASAKQEDDNAGAVSLDLTILSPIRWNTVEAY